MSEKKPKAAEGQEPKTAPEEAADTPASAQDEAARLEAELSEAREHILRVHAEYENYKKRTAREKEELYALAAADVFAKLFGVFDNLERAYACTDFESLKGGVDMILDSFHASLEACGVREIEALGQEFDPALHNAVLMEEREDYESNTVCEVLQKGYVLGERLLRPAMVKVAQ